MEDKIKRFTFYFGKGTVPRNNADMSGVIENDPYAGEWVNIDQFRELTNFMEKGNYPRGRYEIVYIPKGMYPLV
jgi:hypothetical protein